MLTEFCQENRVVIANTLFQQHKRWHYPWTSPDDQYQIRLIVFFAAEDGEVLYSQQKKQKTKNKKNRLGADCGSDCELLITKFRLKLKKVGKTTRSFTSVQFSSVAQSCWTLQPHGLQHTKLTCPSPTLGVYSNSCPLSWWCHPANSSSVIPFSFCLRSFPASGSLQMSQLFALGGQSIGV